MACEIKCSILHVPYIERLFIAGAVGGAEVQMAEVTSRFCGGGCTYSQTRQGR